jgi:DNA primase
VAQDFVERVRAATDIVALISDSVPLKKAGRKYRGLCPFHPEKTPSFYVDDQKGVFYCFGCQTGGDSFKFVMLRENVEFLEAARLLARRTGIPVPQSGRGGRPSEREALVAAHRAAADFYHELLRTRPEAGAAREYLRARGITDETIARLKIGFAPDRWDTLKSHLTAKGFTSELLVTGGLLSRKDGTGPGSSAGTYDRFRNRVLFPIRNLSGDVVGFGGRILGAGEPKYLNSAETPIYNKRENLFGLDLTRPGIRDAGEAVVVEGYFDFASLFQAGVVNAAATLGTAFSEEQVSLLRRFTERVVINYDPDTAGTNATRRSLDLLLAQGFKIRVLQLEPGADPDEFVRKKGVEAYRSRLASAPRYFEYLLERATTGRDLSDYEAKSAALREVLPILSQVPDRIERAGYVNALAEKLGIDDAVMLAEIKDALLKGGTGARAGATALRGKGAAPAARAMESETRLVRALLESADLRAELLGLLSEDDLAGTAIEAVVRAVEGLGRAGQEISYPRLSEVLLEPARSLLARIAMEPEPVVSSSEALRCVESIRVRRLRREREGLQRQMEAEADPARLDDLMRRKMEVSRQIDSLS